MEAADREDEMGWNTLFLGIIAAVAVGAAAVWWSAQPSAEERRAAERRESTERLEQSVDDYVETTRQLRALD